MAGRKTPKIKRPKWPVKIHLPTQRRPVPKLNYSQIPLDQWPSADEISAGEAAHQLRSLRGIRAELETRLTHLLGGPAMPKKLEKYPLFAFGESERLRRNIRWLDEREGRLDHRLQMERQRQNAPRTALNQRELPFMKMPAGPPEIRVNRKRFEYPPGTRGEKKALFRAAMDEIGSLEPDIYEMERKSAKLRNRASNRRWMAYARDRRRRLEALIRWLQEEGIEP